MIPKLPELIEPKADGNAAHSPYSSKTYKIDYHSSNPKIKGMIDGTEAIRQSIWLILHTERYKYPIYSWDYGVELLGLFGQPISFVQSELQRRIAEALSMDDRIIEVGEFAFAQQRGKLQVSFTVFTNIGDIAAEMEVDR